MSDQQERIPTPSQFYRERRPENFSDSESVQEALLTKELLAFELSQITTNQKQDQFETLSRRLAEKFVVPNLIPQVGPTGGGDGKTDSETHPVSSIISERWFVPEHGWDKDEKWAIAISAKETWKSKLKSDIKNILSTDREYTKIFFFTNRKPSSKKKKEAQDEYTAEFGIEIIILDAEWILEKTIDNPEIINLVVDSLNLSATYKSKVKIGSYDAARIERLDELESNIQNPNRYSEFDFQLVEDALEVAILSRELERSKDEIEGKFDRALRFCQKLRQPGQLIRVHYQRAWTYINYFDDYSNFILDYRKLKELVTSESSISEVELYFNLFNVLKGVVSAEVFEEANSINLENEKDEIDLLLQSHIRNEDKPSSSLIAQTFKEILDLWDVMSAEQNPDNQFNTLSELFTKSEGHIDYPFDMFKRIVEELGIIFPDNDCYDNLLENIAEISAKRESQLSSAQMYIRRGGTKYGANLYKESVIFFGKALIKLAKEETKHGFYLALMGLSMSYDSLGLPWASYNSLVTATSVPNREWLEKGRFDERMYRCVKKILLNELFIGRLPVILSWNELDHAISTQIQIEEEEGSQYSTGFIDSAFAVRLMDYPHLDPQAYAYLPDLLDSQGLWMSQYSSYYCLGHIKTLIQEFSETGLEDMNNENQLDEYFQKVAHQPFRKQMMCKTDLLSSDEIEFSTIILGARFLVKFNKDSDLFLFAEATLAFLESFLATSMKEVIPSTEQIHITLLKNSEIETINIKNEDASNQYTIEVGEDYYAQENNAKLWENVIFFISSVLSKNFFIDDAERYLTTLFRDEEINERCALIFGHANFTTNILGKEPKLFFNDWIENHNYKKYEKIREIPFDISDEKTVNAELLSEKRTFDETKHNERKVISIIDAPLWDGAGWRGFGFYLNNDNPKMTIFLAFDNEDNAKKIFQGWTNRLGNTDEQDFIRLTIIRGVSKSNPNYYRVHITNDMNTAKIKDGSFFITASRYREMPAQNSQNLDDLIKAYNHFKTYILAPVKLVGSSIEPIEGFGIIKSKIIIKEAWEIGINDTESAVIDQDVIDPIIPPNHTNDAPILEVLKKRRS